MQPNYAQSDRLFRLKVILVLIVGAIALLVALTVYNLTKFRILNTSPTLTQVAANEPYINVIFNKTLSSKGVEVTATNDIFKSSSVSGKTLTIFLNYPLQANKTYTVGIATIYSQSGSSLMNKNLTFTAKNIAYNNLGAGEQKALVSNQDHYTAAEKDPILAHLPYSTLDFILTPTFTTTNGQQQLILQAQLLIAPGITGSQETTDEAQFKQEVLSYIQSLGLNPSNYTIQYQVVNESLNGP